MVAEPMAARVARRFDVFLSYNSADRPAVLRVARHLKQCGLEPWFDRWSLTPGKPWQDEIAEGMRDSAAFALFVGPEGVGDWARLELSAAWSQAVTDDRFRLIPVLLPGVGEFDSGDLPPFLSTRTWVDLRPGIAAEGALQDLRNAVLGLPFGADIVAQVPDGLCPYVGLAPFGEADAQYFFGRENQVQRLLERIGNRRLVAVIGPSGSGKSSLVRAGLLPRVREGALPGSEEWPIRVLRPGAFPVRALSTAMLDVAPTPAMELGLERLRTEEHRLHEATERVLLDAAPERRVLLVVDQAEELFTHCKVDVERRAFLAAVHHATAVPHGRTTVVFTLRADFYPKLSPYRAFAQFVADHQMLIGGLVGDEIRQVIEGPAAVVGLRVEDGLVQTITADVLRAPGSLPLLQHALRETWRRKRSDVLTLAAYHQAGGVERGLAERAEAVYGGLPPSDRDAVRDLLLRLVQPGEGTADTRRRVRLREVTASDDVIRLLTTERLLTTSGQGLQTWVEITHEALLNGWPRLQEWIRTDQDGQRTRRALTAATQDWERLEHDAGALYRGTRLSEAREWSARDGSRLNDQERAFLAASEKADAADRTRRQRLTRWWIAVLATALAVISTVAVIAIGNAREAARQRDVAISRQLAAGAVDVLAADPSLSLALAMRAYASAPTVQAEEVLRRAAAAPQPVATLSIPGGPVYSARLLDDGRSAVTTGADGALRVWDVPSGQATATIPGHQGIVTSVRVSADHKQLASTGLDDTVALVSLPDHRRRVVVQASGGYATSADFSPDGRLLAASLSDGSVRLVDTTSGRETANLHLGPAPVYRVAFRPDGKAVIASCDDGTAQIWDITTRTPTAVLRGHTGPVLAATFDPTGRRAVTAGSDGTVRVWDAVSGTAIRVIPVDDQALFAVAVSPDGRRVAVAGEDGLVRIRSIDGVELASLPGHAGEVFDVAFDRAGRLISAGRDGTARVWEPDRDDAIALSASWAEYSPDGRRIVVGTDDGHVHVFAADGFEQQLDLVGPGKRNWPRFSPDGTRIVSAYENGAVEVWNARDGVPVAQLHPQRAQVPIWSAALDPANGEVLTGAEDGSVVISHLDGRAAEHLPTQAGSVNVVVFSPDGATIASAGGAGTIRLWSRAGSTRLLAGHEGGVRALAMAPGGALLASAGADGTVRVWRMADGVSVAVLHGHQGPVDGVAFAPDGTLVSTGDDGSVRVWDTAGARLIVALPVNTTPGTSVAVSPDERTVLTVSAEGGVVRQTYCAVCGPIATVLDLARARGARPLRPEEEQRYLS